MAPGRSCLRYAGLAPDPTGGRARTQPFWTTAHTTARGAQRAGAAAVASLGSPTAAQRLAAAPGQGGQQRTAAGRVCLPAGHAGTQSLARAALLGHFPA